MRSKDVGIIDARQLPLGVVVCQRDGFIEKDPDAKRFKDWNITERIVVAEDTENRCRKSCNELRHFFKCSSIHVNGEVIEITRNHGDVILQVLNFFKYDRCKRRVKIKMQIAEVENRQAAQSRVEIFDAELVFPNDWIHELSVAEMPESRGFEGSGQDASEETHRTNAHPSTHLQLPCVLLVEPLGEEVLSHAPLDETLVFIRHAVHGKFIMNGSWVLLA